MDGTGYKTLRVIRNREFIVYNAHDKVHIYQQAKTENQTAFSKISAWEEISDRERTVWYL